MDVRDGGQLRAPDRVTTTEEHTARPVTGRTVRGASPVPAAVVTVGTMALATVPTPLYPAYARAFGIDETGTTVLFAVFALGAVAGLSIVRTRRCARWPVRGRIVAAALLGAAAAVVLAVVPGLPAFAVGRLLSGLGVGIAAASAVTFVTDRARAAGRHVRFWATVTPGLAMAGLALGPAVAGLLVGTGALPRWALYVAVATVLTTSAALLAPRASRPVVPEATHGGPPPTSGADTRSRVPRWPDRLGACAAFAVTGCFGALTPHLLAGGDRQPSVTEVGVVAALPFLAGAIGATVLSGHGRWAFPFVVTGFVLVAVSTATVPGTVTGTATFAVGAAIAGAGAGIVFSRALGSALRNASPDRRGAAASDTFTCAYLGLAVPVVAVGSLLGIVPQTVVIVGFTVVLAGVGTVLVLRPGSDLRGAGR
ncbi:MFS transporter [Curtobacterium sp. C1]|uniref:MFS transporter n=1 Tax=Curtobacterium sp. C1 TaxID=2898151 RepID=UPI001E3A82F6|nr:MFS transporter [Curtobacterium sp. C1]UFU14096.1 MFS transporter [Curtobacterium sp. C1]